MYSYYVLLYYVSLNARKSFLDIKSWNDLSIRHVDHLFFLTLKTKFLCLASSYNYLFASSCIYQLIINYFDENIFEIRLKKTLLNITSLFLNYTIFYLFILLYRSTQFIYSLNHVFIINNIFLRVNILCSRN